MNSKRGRGRKRAMKKANHLSPPQNLAVPRRQDSPAATYLCQSSDSEIALCCRFRQTASQGIAVSRISALRGQIYPVLGCLFLSSFDNVPACFPPHISEPHLFFVKQTVDFRDQFDQAVRILPVSRLHAEPHPTLSLFTFHFCSPPFAGNSAEQTFSERPLLAPFDPKSRTKRCLFAI